MRDLHTSKGVFGGGGTLHMYNIYVKWGEAFSLTHVQHRVIITTLLLKWLTFAFDCPKNMNNNIQLPWLSW